MTDLIRRADVMREMWKHANGKTVLGGQTYQSLTLEVALDAIAALPAVTPKVKPDRETFDAMCAMRDAINEYVPMPSLESDLLQGPENSVFCATVAEAVIAEIRRLRAALEPVEATLAEEEQK